MIMKMDALALKVKNGIAIGYNELREWHRRKKQEIKDYKSAHDRKEFPILHSVEDAENMTTNDRKKFLRYCLSLIAKEHPKEHDLLILLLNGWTHKKVADSMNRQGFNVTILEVKRREGQALRLVTDTIERLRNKGIPIFSDLPA